jgi:predicted enzyme related to lactoylglutathione lyase
MRKVCAQVGGAWNYYIAVESVAKAAERAQGRDAHVLKGPMEVPSGVWIVQGRDPQGAPFAMASGQR